MEGYEKPENIRTSTYITRKGPDRTPRIRRPLDLSINRTVEKPPRSPTMRLWIPPVGLWLHRRPRSRACDRPMSSDRTARSPSLDHGIPRDLVNSFSFPALGHTAAVIRSTLRQRSASSSSSSLSISSLRGERGGGGCCRSRQPAPFLRAARDPRVPPLWWKSKKANLLLSFLFPRAFFR